MPIAWYIAPYIRDLSDVQPARYCAMQNAISAFGLDGDHHRRKYPGIQDSVITVTRVVVTLKVRKT